MDLFLESESVFVEGRGGFNKVSGAGESKKFVRKVFAPRRGDLKLGLSEG